MSIQNPVNKWQEYYNELCTAGGGRRGGPAESKVVQLLYAAASDLNPHLEEDVNATLARLSNLNPWHVCFAIGLTWGHLAKDDAAFTEAAARLMSQWTDEYRKEAISYFLERGPEVLERTLSSGHQLFEKVRLPALLSADLKGLHDAQQRWLGSIVSPQRPPYIGSWNAVAMFMAAIFSKRSLWQSLLDSTVLLPPGGPVYRALVLLHRDGVVVKRPEGNELDESFEPGALYVNQELMRGLLEISPNEHSVVDIHSGLYLLGTNRQWL